MDKLNDHSVVLERHGVLHEKNADELERHIKRTDLLESKLEKDMEVALQPIKAIKFLVKLSAGILTIVAILKLIGIIK
jgi:hypothetical protein